MTLDLATLSDEQLAKRAAAGEREAVAEFVRRNRHVIASRNRWRLRQQPVRMVDTDDLLATLARRLDRYVLTRGIDASGPGKLFQLVSKVAENAAREVLRRSRRADRRMRGWAETRGREESSVPAGLLSQTVQAAGLTEMDATILRLRSTGMSYQAIAEHLSLKSATVRQRTHRAINELREFVSNDVSEVGATP